MIDQSVSGTDGWVCSLGAYSRGSQQGLITESKYRPMLLRLVNRFIAALDATHVYTAVRLSFQVASGWHRDLHNETNSTNLLVKLSAFTGGRVVLEDGPVDFDGQGVVRFDPKQHHSVEPAVGPRLVLIAYTPARSAQLSLFDLNILLSLGFNVPVELRPQPMSLPPIIKTLAKAATGQDALPDPKPGRECACGLTAVEGMCCLEFPLAGAVPGEFTTAESDRYLVCCMQSLGKQSLDLAGSSSPNVPLGGSPCADWDDWTHEYEPGNWDVSERPRSFDQCSWQSAEASNLFENIAMYDSMELEAETLKGIVEQLEEALTGVPNRAVKLLRLRGLAQIVDESLVGTYHALMKTQIEASIEGLGTGEPPLLGDYDPEVLLQTRHVSLAEARRNLEQWRQAIADELTALTVVHNAVSIVTQSDIDRMVGEGITIQTIPGKLVLTEKAPDRRKRARLVGCGNFLPDTQSSDVQLQNPVSDFAASPSVVRAEGRRDLYATGLEAEGLRIQLRFGAGMRWLCVVVDVKTAFLLAPTRKKSGTRIVVSIPHLVIEAGLIEPEPRSFLLVDRALYGLQESPSDWSHFRDATFRDLSWSGPDGSLRKLLQTDSDPSIWLVLEALVKHGGTVEFRDRRGRILAILGVYVDDLLATGPRDELDCFLVALAALWKTSEPVWITEGIQFCGVEVDLAEDGAYLLHQSSYLRDLVSRYTLPDSCVLPDFKTGYTEVEVVAIPILRRAQKLVGELLWLTGKTRPDAAFHVNKLGQYCSKFPAAVYRDGLHVLGYIAKTSNLRLRYGLFTEPWKGDEPLRYPRSMISVESWSDASFGQDDGSRSQSGVLLILAGGLVSWHSSRQTITALSTAESEVIAAVETMTLGRAVSPTWAELCRSDLHWSVCIDNSACVQLLVIPGGAWRTRHLRLRANHFREAIAEEALLVQHVLGVEMLSDLLTKPLSEPTMQHLLRLLGFVTVECAETSVSTCPSVDVSAKTDQSLIAEPGSVINASRFSANHELARTLAVAALLASSCVR